VDAVETTGPQGLAMALPRAIPVTASADVALLMPGTPLGGASDSVYTLTLASTAGTLTASPARTGDSSAVAALVDLDAASGTVRLSGTIATLNTWLGMGRLVYNGPAATLNATLSLGAQSVSSAIELSAGAASSSPALSAPGVLPVVPAAASPVVFAADAFGSGTAARSVTLRVADGGIFNASGATEAGITAVGNGSSTLTLTGSADALSAYLSASPARVNYTGLASRVDADGTRAQTLRVAVELGVNRADAEVALYGATSAFNTAPAIGELSSRLWVTPSVSSQLKFDQAALSGTGTLTLSVALPVAAALALAEGQGLAATIASNGAVVVDAASTPRTLVLRGTAPQLAALLSGSSGELRYVGPGALADNAPIALQITLADSLGHASRTAVSIAAPAATTATLTGATLTLPVSRVVTAGARVPLMLGEQALQAANNPTISVEIEAPPPSVSVTGLAEGSVTLTAGTVAVTAGTTYTRTINGVSLQIASTRFTGNVAALNQLFSSANGVFVERAAGESIAIRVVGDISSRGSVSVTAAPVADTVVAGPALTVPAGYALPSGGMILLPAQAVAGAGTLKLQLTVSTGTLAWGASQTLRAAASDTDTIEAGTGNTLTLVGTAADLNAFLSSRDALRFMGSADALLGFELTAPPQSAGEPARVARAESAIDALSISLERAADVGLRLPQGIALAATGATSLVFDHDVVIADAAQGPVTLLLTLPAAVAGADAPALTLADDATDALPAGADGVAIQRLQDGSIELSGSADNLNAYLRGATSLSYTGRNARLRAHPGRTARRRRHAHEAAHVGRYAAEKRAQACHADQPCARCRDRRAALWRRGDPAGTLVQPGRHDDRRADRVCRPAQARRAARCAQCHRRK
jgi:hypothetical protein